MVHCIFASIEFYGRKDGVTAQSVLGFRVFSAGFGRMVSCGGLFRCRRSGC